jgi:N-acetylmuramoyl-L-alanine amidase CwlA
MDEVGRPGNCDDLRVEVCYQAQGGEWMKVEQEICDVGLLQDVGG